MPNIFHYCDQFSIQGYDSFGKALFYFLNFNHVYNKLMKGSEVAIFQKDQAPFIATLNTPVRSISVLLSQPEFVW